MSNTTTSGWSAEDGHANYLERWGRLALKVVSIGVLAGMGAFVYNATEFVPFEVDERVLLLPMFAAGVFAHLFSSTLQESTRLAIFGFFGGLAVFLAGWIAPLWILPYSTTAIDIMLPSMVGEVMSAAFLNYSATFLGGYLITLSAAAFWE